MAILMGLTACKTPFQCAHGRPSVCPIVKLQKPSQNEIHQEKTGFQPMALDLRNLMWNKFKVLQSQSRKLLQASQSENESAISMSQEVDSHEINVDALNSACTPKERLLKSVESYRKKH